MAAEQDIADEMHRMRTQSEIDARKLEVEALRIEITALRAERDKWQEHYEALVKLRDGIEADLSATLLRATRAEAVCAEAYQAVGVLCSIAGFWDKACDPSDADQMDKLLTALSDAQPPEGGLLPFQLKAEARATRAEERAGRLEAALRPFAETTIVGLAPRMIEWPDDVFVCPEIRLGDLRAASTALATPSEQP